jgi:hypothetical protein
MMLSFQGARSAGWWCYGVRFGYAVSLWQCNHTREHHKPYQYDNLCLLPQYIQVQNKQYRFPYQSFPAENRHNQDARHGRDEPAPVSWVLYDYCKIIFSLVAFLSLLAKPILLLFFYRASKTKKQKETHHENFRNNQIKRRDNRRNHRNRLHRFY